MDALKTGAKILLALMAPPVGLALLVGIPLGAFALVDILFEEAMLALFVPGFALYVFAICLPAGLYHAAQKIGRAPSGAFRLPSVLWLGAGAVAAIAIGHVLLGASGSRSPFVFWFFFILSAALPPLAALALAGQRLGYATSWRRLAAGWLSGSLLSTHLTILLGAGMSLLAYLLVLPLRELAAAALASPSLERLFYSPTLAVAMVEIAMVAPLVEELVKPLGAILLARRLRSPAEAFLVGMAGGAGFAILENMLYEASGARVWAGIAAVRGMGGVLHPLNAGLVAMGWYAVRNGHPGAWGQLLRHYGLAVGLHALWNGGLVVLFSGLGAYFFGADAWQVSIYGLGQPGTVVVYLVILSVFMWRLLVVVTPRLRDPAQAEAEAEPLLALHLENPRRLALWATSLMVVLATLGALYGPLIERYVDRLLPLG